MQLYKRLLITNQRCALPFGKAAFCTWLCIGMSRNVCLPKVQKERILLKLLRQNLIVQYGKSNARLWALFLFQAPLPEGIKDNPADRLSRSGYINISFLTTAIFL